MTQKKIGTFEIEYQATEYSDGELTAGFIYDDEFWALDDFMRSDSEYDAIMGLTNTSAYGLNIDESGDEIELFLLY